jgi:hypothetical protein
VGHRLSGLLRLSHDREHAGQEKSGRNGTPTLRGGAEHAVPFDSSIPDLESPGHGRSIIYDMSVWGSLAPMMPNNRNGQP